MRRPDDLRAWGARAAAVRSDFGSAVVAQSSGLGSEAVDDAVARFGDVWTTALGRRLADTYTAIEVKGGTGSRDAAQRGFDGTVSSERPATAILNGEKIQIIRVVLETVK